MMHFKVNPTTRIEIQTDEEDYIGAIDLHPVNGPSGFSGRLFIEQGDGRRVAVDALRMLHVVWEHGVESGRNGTARK